MALSVYLTTQKAKQDKMAALGPFAAVTNLAIAPSEEVHLLARLERRKQVNLLDSWNPAVMAVAHYIYLVAKQDRILAALRDKIDSYRDGDKIEVPLFSYTHTYLCCEAHTDMGGGRTAVQNANEDGRDMRARNLLSAATMMLPEHLAAVPLRRLFTGEVGKHLFGLAAAFIGLHFSVRQNQVETLCDESARGFVVVKKEVVLRFWEKPPQWSRDLQAKARARWGVPAALGYPASAAVPRHLDAVREPTHEEAMQESVRQLMEALEAAAAPVAPAAAPPVAPPAAPPVAAGGGAAGGCPACTDDGICRGCDDELYEACLRVSEWGGEDDGGYYEAEVNHGADMEW